jgi:hypothetical protein
VYGRLYGRGTQTLYGDQELTRPLQQVVGEFYHNKAHGQVRAETKH